MDVVHRISHTTFKEARKYSLSFDLEEKENNYSEALADSATVKESHFFDLRNNISPWQNLTQGYQSERSHGV